MFYKIQHQLAHLTLDEKPIKVPLKSQVYSIIIKDTITDLNTLGHLLYRITGDISIIYRSGRVISSTNGDSFDNLSVGFISNPMDNFLSLSPYNTFASFIVTKLSNVKYNYNYNGIDHEVNKISARVDGYALYPNNLDVCKFTIRFVAGSWVFRVFKGEQIFDLPIETFNALPVRVIFAEKLKGEKDGNDRI